MFVVMFVACFQHQITLFAFLFLIHHYIIIFENDNLISHFNLYFLYCTNQYPLKKVDCLFLVWPKIY